MKEIYYEGNGENYPICVKQYLPEEEIIDHVILGLHGFAGDKESSALRMLAETMIPHRTTVLCFDWPAHGTSPVNGEQLLVKNCLRDLHTVIMEIRSRYPQASYGVFATSFGGYLALLGEEDLEDFRMVLRAPAVIMGSLIYDVLLETEKETFLQKGKQECGFERKMMIYPAFAEELEEQDVFHRKYNRSMLVISGDQDITVPYETVREFCSRQPHAEFVTICGADHRFKNPGEMEQVISAAEQYFLQAK